MSNFKMLGSDMSELSDHDLSAFVSAQQLEKNTQDVNLIKDALLTHKVFQNPCIAFFQDNLISLETVKQIHLDYRFAIVQIFTDALLAAAYHASQLEENFLLPAGIKMLPRFLLLPNFQDEFGVSIENNQLTGSPLNAHYPLFEQVLKSLAVSPEDLKNFIPSPSAKQLRAFLQAHYSDFLNITALLAAAELQVVIFSPILRAMLDLQHIDTSSGYYFVHGASTETGGLACDDEHADDLWRCLVLAINFTSIADIQNILTQYMDLWDDFWTQQLARATSVHKG